jgi:SAM-dependent methyltransferase
MNSSEDPRGIFYEDLNRTQLQNDRDTNAHSARTILEIAAQYFSAKSMLDVGCGLGTWLAVAQQMGIEVAGVEGPWCEIDKLEVDRGLVKITDLEKPIELGRRFDFAVCLEVGEHLSPNAAPHLVDSLVRHSDLILFSAAIPFQGGHHHVNEKFLNYWLDLFAQQGFIGVDIFRAQLWTDSSIHWWLRQNLVLIGRESVIHADPKLHAESLVKRPMDIVHPDVYLAKVHAAKYEFFTLQQTLLQSGLATLKQTPLGMVFELVRGPQQP